jgi:hypothetical protein
MIVVLERYCFFGFTFKDATELADDDCAVFSIEPFNNNFFHLALSFLYRVGRLLAPVACVG